MTDFISLYNIAEKEGVSVVDFSLPETGSICIQGSDNKCFIGMDEKQLQTESSKKVHLGHELGHCCTGSFYNRYAACDIRQKHENRANIWAIQELVPEEELREAIADESTNLFSLAERFDVTEEFMKMAICWYMHGTLAIDLYYD